MAPEPELMVHMVYIKQLAVVVVVEFGISCGGESNGLLVCIWQQAGERGVCMYGVLLLKVESPSVSLRADVPKDKGEISDTVGVQ